MTPKSKKCFFNIILEVPKVFKISKKNEIHVVALLVCYRHAKFELGNLIFGKVMAKKLLKVDDVTLKIYFFAVVDHVLTTKLRPPLDSP